MLPNAARTLPRPFFLPNAEGEDAVLGRLDLYGDVPRIETKGNLYSSRPRYLRERWGDKMIAAVGERLSPTSRKLLLEPPLPFQWTPYENLVEIDYRIVEVAMDGEVSRMKEFGAAIATYDLPLSYRILFKVGTPGFVVSRFPTAFRAYFRPGDIRVDASKTSAAISLEGAVYPRYMCEQGIAGWCRRAVELSGGVSVAANHVECRHRGDSRCTYKITWR